MGATDAIRSWLETNEKQAINRHFGTISGWIGPFSSQIAQVRTAILTRSASCARSKEECLNRMVLFGRNALERALREYRLHYLRERNHQGLGNRLLDDFPPGRG